MTGQRILVVDDDLHIRRLLQGTLARAGYEAIEAVTAAEALALARAARPDAVLLDLRLPDRDVLGPLARSPGRVVTHKQVLESAWPYDVDRRIDYLRIVVRNLRRKLEPDPSRPTLIVNELGVGYRLMADS